MEDQHNDHGWFIKIRTSSDGALIAACRAFLAAPDAKNTVLGKISGESEKEVEQAEVAALHPDSRLMKAYSLNEPYFGNLMKAQSEQPAVHTFSYCTG